MNLAARITHIMSSKQWSAADVARAAQVSPSAVSQWLGNGNKPIQSIGDIEVAERLSRQTGLSPLWIAKGLGGMERHAPNADPATLSGCRVPLISSIQAGTWREIVDNFQPGDAEDWIITAHSVSRSAFALTINGDSMYKGDSPDSFREGDTVVIDPNVQPKPGSFVAARNGQHEATFKKYRPRGLNEKGVEYFELVPLNPDYPTLRSDLEPIEIIGTAVEHRKKI